MGAAALLVCLWLPLASAEPIRANRALGEITVDGILDESAWGHTHPIPLRRSWDADRPWPRRPGEALAVWDDEAIYFAARFVDEDLHATVTERDGDTHRDDVFEVFLMVGDDADHYFEFHVNALGAVRDMRIDHPRDQPFAAYTLWRSGIAAAVALDGTLNAAESWDEGWSAEMRIPWRDLGITAPTAGMRLRFMVARYDYRSDGSDPELSASATLTEPNFHRVAEYDWLVLWDAEAATAEDARAENEAEMEHQNE